jgi:aerobic-type carbon monoxide dehydrogenase small subunit (CoxS/CutS family)
MDFILNGRPASSEVEPGTSLLELLREGFGLRSMKDGCAPEGTCGACTVLVDGRPVVSCARDAERVAGREVVTLEGLSEEARTAWADAFVATGASQCGFCSPGIVMKAEGLLAREAAPSRDEIARSLAGNLCRCTGYSAIVAAVKAASGRDATPAMVLPGEAEELTVEVSTDPETLAIVEEAVEAAVAELSEGAAPAPEAFPSPDAPAGPPAAPAPSPEGPAGSSDTGGGE